MPYFWNSEYLWVSIISVRTDLLLRYLPYDKYEEKEEESKTS